MKQITNTMKALIFILSNFGIMLALAALTIHFIVRVFFPEARAKKQRHERLLKEIEAAYYCTMLNKQTKI